MADVLVYTRVVMLNESAYKRDREEVMVGGVDGWAAPEDMGRCVCLSIGVNPLQGMPFISIAAEYGKSGAAIGDSENYKRVWMTSPVNVLIYADVVQMGPQLVRPDTRLVMPGERGA